MPPPTLALAADRFGLPVAERAALAPGLGADVPFCLAGGTARMEGYGERGHLAAAAGRLLAGGGGASLRDLHRGRLRPLGRPGRAPGPGRVEGRDLPPQLRPYEPWRNDLVPAARALAPGLGDWVADLQRRWGRAVLMSGSGPSLFAFFPTASEAEGAAGRRRRPGGPGLPPRGAGLADALRYTALTP